MSITTFGKKTNQLIIDNKLVENSCTEMIGNNNEFIIKNCDYPLDNEFVHAIFAQLASNRKLVDRLKEDFDIDDSLEDLKEGNIVEIEPITIGFETKKKLLSKKKSKKKNNNKSKKNKKNN